MMKQLVSYYRMPGDKEEDVLRMVRAAGLDGIENLIYGRVPADPPFAEVTGGVHLKYWPYWMDFYTGNTERLRESFANRAALRAYYGADTVEGWIRAARENIQAALAEKPAYLVWHVQECTVEEAWTWQFHYTDEEVLRAAAEVYHACADLIPDGVRVLFENIFWPGLFHLEPEKVDFFFQLVDDEAHTGIMFDTGHFMNTNADLVTEADGAAYICGMVERLGSLKSLIHGIHLSCSLSGEYQHHFLRRKPDVVTGEVMMGHICAIDQHRPFRTHAARQIVECIEPEYVVHELFGMNLEEALGKVRIQQQALGRKESDK